MTRSRPIAARAGARIRSVARAATLLACGLLASSAPAAVAGERIEREIPVAPGGTLVIELDRGHIEVETHERTDRLRLEVEARGLGASSVDFEVDRRGDVITLRGTQEDWLEYTTVPPRIAVRAWVPAAFAVKLATADGEVAARGIRGSVAARSSDGDIELREIGGAVEAETRGGAVRASFSEAPRGRLESGGGDIALSFPAEARVTLDATSRGGRLWSDGSVTLPVESRPQRWSGPLNGGGDALEIRGSGGNIRLRTLGTSLRAERGVARTSP